MAISSGKKRLFMPSGASPSVFPSDLKRFSSVTSDGGCPVSVSLFPSFFYINPLAIGVPVPRVSCGTSSEFRNPRLFRKPAFASLLRPAPLSFPFAAVEVEDEPGPSGHKGTGRSCAKMALYDASTFAHQSLFCLPAAPQPVLVFPPRNGTPPQFLGQIVCSAFPPIAVLLDRFLLPKNRIRRVLKSRLPLVPFLGLRTRPLLLQQKRASSFQPLLSRASFDGLDSNVAYRFVSDPTSAPQSAIFPFTAPPGLAPMV